MIVGWYTSVFLGAYFTKKIVENHAEHQASKPETILLAFDPAPTAQGLLSLKALRLTDTFMDEWRNQTRHGSEAFTRLAPSSIFESLPVKIRNSHLIQLFMADLIDNKALQSPLALRPAAALTSGLEKQHASTSSTISSSVGHAVGSTAAGVAAAELETDFARLDLATGAWPLLARAFLRRNHAQSPSPASSFLHMSSVVRPFTRTPTYPPPAAPFLEKHMEEISQLTDDFLDMQNSKKFLDKDIQANMAQLNDWLANRRAENDRRRAEGQEILPEFDASLPFFKAVTDKSGRDSLDTCLLSAQVTAYCQSVSRFTDTTFGKLFLAAALQK